jgi:hypothetical protein
MCWCGQGIDASLCAARLISGDGAIPCGCAATVEPCLVRDDGSTEGRGSPCVEHDTACPQCHTLSVDAPTIDYVLGEAPDAAAPLPVLTTSFDADPCTPPIARATFERGRAPPVVARAAPGLWPGVRPLRI